MLIPFRALGALKSSKGLEFKAAIPVYGHCGNLNKDSKVPFPMMQIVGEEGPIAISCYKTGANKNMELNILPGVYHAFGSVVACGK